MKGEREEDRMKGRKGGAGTQDGPIMLQHNRQCSYAPTHSSNML